MKFRLIFLFAALLSPLLTQAKLSVKMDEPKIVGEKSVIKLTLKNTFSEKIESARATIFLLDDQGKMVGQATKWVIGGTKDKPALEPNKETTFNFVVPADKPFTKTEITITKIILKGGVIANPKNSFEITK